MSENFHRDSKCHWISKEFTSRYEKKKKNKKEKKEIIFHSPFHISECGTTRRETQSIWNEFLLVSIAQLEDTRSKKEGEGRGVLLIHTQVAHTYMKAFSLPRTGAKEERLVPCREASYAHLVSDRIFSAAAAATAAAEQGRATRRESPRSSISPE